MMNLTIAGNLGRDAETRDTQSGSVTSFSVAVQAREGRDKKTYWYDVSLWGKRGEAIRSYLTKGTKVCVTGQFGTRQHDGKTYLKISASEVTLMGGVNRDQGGSTGGGYGGQSSGHPAVLDDEIPFLAEWR